MSYSQHLSAILNAIKTAWGWSEAYTYMCPGRPGFVVFHNGTLSATAVDRVVVSDMAGRGPKFVTQLAGTIIEQGKGTDHCQVLCPKGADPDADSVTISRSDWESMSPADQDAGLDTGSVITIVSDVAAEDVPGGTPVDQSKGEPGESCPPPEHARTAPIEPSNPVPTHISEARPFPPESHPMDNIGRVPASEWKPNAVPDPAAGLPDNACDPPGLTSRNEAAKAVVAAHPGKVTSMQVGGGAQADTTMLQALVKGADLDDDQSAFVVRQNLEVAIATMNGKPAFNAAISLVRSGLGVCPKTSITV